MKNRRITRQQLVDFAGEKPVSRELVHRWKEMHQERYATRSVNAMLASLNSFLSIPGRSDCRMKTLRIRRQAHCPETRAVTKEEHLRLLRSAERKPKLYLMGGQ